MKWIIVTGDSRGLGKEIVKKILDDTEFNVIGISRATSDEVSDLKDKYQNRFVHITFDLLNVSGIKELYLKQIKQYGVIYGLVNNSAMAYDDIVSNLNMERLENMYKVNVFSPMHLSKYVIRDMLLNKVEGSLVYISSVSVHTAYKGLSMYASTKGALEAFSKGIAREWGSKGIRSNCVVPGFMETAMSESLTEDQKNRIYNRTSLKKETSPESVADMVVFLLTEKAKSITGTEIHVDNGTI
jgi:3-oxoacyl-[acyl-carrier protein] reductase